MWRIFLKDTCIYDDRIPKKEYKVINPVLTLEDTAGGSLTFTVPPTNRCYSYIDGMERCMMFVMKDGFTDEYWGGRILSIDTDLWGQKKVECEGAFSFFADCTNNVDELYYHGQNNTQMTDENWVAYCMLTDAISGYNNYSYVNSQNVRVYVDKVEDRFKIQVGRVTVEISDYIDSNGYMHPVAKSTSKTCLENLLNLQNTYGGHMKIRFSNGLMFLDWLKDYEGQSTQIIDFGKNILDFTQVSDISNLFTVIHPLGEAIDTQITYTDVTPAFTYSRWIDNYGSVQTSQSDANYFAYTGLMTIDSQKTYYYSGRMKGNYTIYAIYDGSNPPVALSVVRSGAEKNTDIKGFEKQKISIPEGAKYIRFAWYKDDNYKYKDSNGNEHVYAVADYSKVQTTPVNIDAYKPRTNIASVNNNSEYLDIPLLRSAYGWIEKTVIFDNINQPQGLKNVAQKYLSSYGSSFAGMTIEVKAIDLSLLNASIDSIEFLDLVTVRSALHGIQGVQMPVTKVTIPMDKPEQQTFTLGVAVRKAISDMIWR